MVIILCVSLILLVCFCLLCFVLFVMVCCLCGVCFVLRVGVCYGLDCHWGLDKFLGGPCGVCVVMFRLWVDLR